MAETNVGLDLGSASIKVVELTKIGHNKFKLLKSGSIAAPLANLLSDSSIDQEAAAQAIKKLIKDSKITNQEVRVALPESQVFTFIIETPSLSERELASAIQWEAEQYIPLPLEEVVLDWKILVQGKNASEKNQVLLVGSPKKVVEKYQNILDLAGLSPIVLETELIAASRVLLSSVPQLKSLMIVNMGAETTDFSIIHEGMLLFTRSFSTSGIAFTRAIKQTLQLTESQAEEYKKTYGIEEDKLEGKITKTLQPLLELIVNELRKGIGFFGEKYPEQKIEAILLSGGSSLLPGLVPYFARELEIETQIGNPFSFIEIDSKNPPPFNLAESTIYTVAVGLALREVI